MADGAENWYRASLMYAIDEMGGRSAGICFIPSLGAPKVGQIPWIPINLAKIECKTSSACQEID